MANVFIMQASASLADDLFQLGQSNDIQFTTMQNTHHFDAKYNDSDGLLISIFLRVDSHSASYDREVYSILEFLGDLGGLYSSLFVIGFYVITFVTERLFVSQILN